MESDHASSSVDELLEDLEELCLGDLAISVLIDGLDELADLVALDIPVAAEALEGIVDQAKDLAALQGARFIRVVFVKNGVDGLTQLVVTGF